MLPTSYSELTIIFGREREWRTVLSFPPVRSLPEEQNEKGLCSSFTPPRRAAPRPPLPRRSAPRLASKSSQVKRERIRIYENYESLVEVRGGEEEGEGVSGGGGAALRVICATTVSIERLRAAREYVFEFGCRSSTNTVIVGNRLGPVEEGGREGVWVVFRGRTDHFRFT